MKPVTVAVCRDCWEQGEGFYLDVDEAGSECPYDHDGVRRKLVKRRLYICERDSCDHMGYRHPGDLTSHYAETHEPYEASA